MVTRGKNKSQIKVMTGNAAAAYGAMLCRPEVVCSYPITPQTEVVEQMSRFHADGILDAEMVEAEGENSAMNIVAAASVAGAMKLLDKRVIDRKERIVCELTGTGLKSIKEYEKIVSKAYLVDPNLGSLEKVLK